MLTNLFRTALKSNEASDLYAKIIGRDNDNLNLEPIDKLEKYLDILERRITHPNVLPPKRQKRPGEKKALLTLPEQPKICADSFGGASDCPAMPRRWMPDAYGSKEPELLEETDQVLLVPNNKTLTVRLAKGYVCSILFDKYILQVAANLEQGDINETGESLTKAVKIAEKIDGGSAERKEAEIICSKYKIELFKLKDVSLKNTDNVNPTNNLLSGIRKYATKINVRMSDGKTLVANCYQKSNNRHIDLAAKSARPVGYDKAKSEFNPSEEIKFVDEIDAEIPANIISGFSARAKKRSNPCSWTRAHCQGWAQSLHKSISRYLRHNTLTKSKRS